MKNFKQFMSESVNISGDFNGNLYINSQDQQPQEEVGESYVADITWQNNIYRIEMVTKTGLPSKQELAELIIKFSDSISPVNGSIAQTV